MLWTTRHILFAFFCFCLIVQADSVFAQSIENRGSAITSFGSFDQSGSLKFIPNRGQLSDQNGAPMPEVLYTLDGYGMKTYFTKGSMHYVFSKLSRAKDSLGRPLTPNAMDIEGSGNQDTLSLYRVDVNFIGANPDAEIAASDTTGDYTNYYLTNCPDGITHVPGFRTIVYKNIYPEIDLVFYTNNPSQKDYLEYDFIVHPGGDPNVIRMSYDHATSLSVDEGGVFHLASPYGNVDETKPNGYQIGASTNENVPCGFKLHDNTVSFETGNYDHARDLYIDPQRLWGTYYGWADTDNYTPATDLVVDRSGNADLYGYTDGTANIATSGAYQTTYGGGAYDCFIAKFGSSGNLMWATYYGGKGDDYSAAIACDTSRGILITGNTTSTSGIASSGAFQTTFTGNEDAFLASFDSNGVRRWATYYSGNGLTPPGPMCPCPSNTVGCGIAIDSATNIVLIGESGSTSGIATSGAFETTLAGPGVNLFIAKFTSQGSRLWGTYWGGTDNTPGANANMADGQVCADANNNIYITASTTCTAGVATAGAYQTLYGPAFFAKFSPSGALDWATYYLDSIFPYTTEHQIYQIAASRSGNLYFVGSEMFGGMASPGAYQTSVAGDSDAILGKFNTNGKRVWATYYGGDSNDVLCAITLDTGENIFACGETASPNKIATAGEFQTSLLPPYNPFIIKFDSGGHRKWGTYYERRGYGLGIGLDPGGHVFVGGLTYTGTDEYATPGAYDGTPWGDGTAFVAKFCDPLEMSITSTTSDTVCPNTTVSLSTRSGLASYQWLLNGSAIAGATTNPYTFISPTNPLRPYYYTVNGVGSDMCDVISDTFALVVRSVPEITMPVGNNVCPGSSIKLLPTIAGWTGPLKYAWTPAATLDHPDSLQPTATPTQGTTYTLAVTDSNGCVTTGKLTVSFYGVPKITLPVNQTVCAGSSIAITAAVTGGLPGYTYLWSPAAGLNRTDTSTVIATVAKNTTFHVTATDAHGCSSEDSLLLVVTLAPAIKVSSPLSVCKGSSIALGGTVSGGTRPYTYLWTPSASLSDSASLTPTATPDSTTLYILTVTDKNGCSSLDSVLVTVSDSLTPTITGGPWTLCMGDTAHLSAGTGYTSYVWSDGETTPDISVTQAGDYTVHVTGGTGCAGTSAAVHITVLPDSVPHPVLTAAKRVICNGDSIQISPIETYASYLWSTGDTTPTIFVSTTDTITLTAANAAGCSGTSAPLVVTVLPTPVATVTINGSDTLCGSDSLTLAAQSGYAKYEWSSGDTTSAIVVKTSGIYSVTVTNAGGCSATSAPDTVTVNPTPELFIHGPAAICPNATATYTDSSNINMANDLFTWSLTPAGAGNLSINNPGSITVQWGAAGTATLTLTETTPSGCSATDSIKVTISSNLTPIVTASEPTAFCPGDSVTLDAGAGYASYQWSMNGQPIAGATHERLTVNQSGAYTVFVTSVGGCSGTSAVTNVTAYPVPATPVITQNGAELTSSPSSHYQWYFDGSPLMDSIHQTLSPDTNGNYTVTITDTNGCESTSDPYPFSDSVVLRARVSVRGTLGAPGVTVSIPLVLDSGTNLAKSGATTYAASITLDGRMLKPINPVGVAAGNDWIVSLSGNTPNAPGVLQTITALATASIADDASGLCSAITIDTFYFPGAPIEVTTVSGLFCDSGTCSPAITSGAPAFIIEKLYPNPSESAFTVEYHVTQDGPLSIAIEDYLGRTVTVLKDEWTTAGDENESYSTQAISSGVYRLVLRSGAKVASTVLIVAK